MSREHTEEWKKQMSKIAKERGFGKWMLGKKLSEETRRKISLATTGPKNPFYGRKHSIKTLRKYHEQRLGKPHPHKGSSTYYVRRSGPQTEEEKLKRSIALRGRKLPLEQRLKMSVSRRRYLKQHPLTFLKKDTAIEIALKSALDRLHLKYVSQHHVIFDNGSSHFIDVAIPEAKIALEADGDYWHSTTKQMARDKYIDEQLVKRGWIVLRIRETTIKQNIEHAIGCLKLFAGILNHPEELEQSVREV